MANVFGSDLQHVPLIGSSRLSAWGVPVIRGAALFAVASGWIVVTACSSSGSQASSQGAGGAIGLGGTNSIAGSLSTAANGGFTTSSGGVTTSRGTPASGGSQAAGGTSATGSREPGTGGAVVVGGTSSTGSRAGGTRAAGGSSSNGGSSTTTRATGGASSTSGASSRAGASSTGGTTATRVATGGTTFGGQPTTGATGGVLASGGTSNGGAGSGGLSTGGSAAGGRSQVTATPGSTLVKVNPSSRYQTFEGWGTSLCWWANRLGHWSPEKRNKFLDLITNPTTGLGYNIFRFNIGGGENPSHTHMTEFRDMPGFQPTQGTWDWNADAAQTAVLTQLLATAQGVILEAFSNSPPYWMTKSGCASGNGDGSNNLKDDSYDAFASYLTDIVKHYRDELGITFRTLEPMNEPNANWWKSNGSQEGCHFSASNQQQIIKAVGAQLKSKGLSDATQISASDENSMDDAYSIISGYDSTTLGYMAQLNVHSYAGSRRKELKSLATSKNKRLWQSESGPLSVELASNTDSALFMAERIIKDLRELQPSAWIDWQVVDTSANWSSFSFSDSQQTGTPVKRFYMHANFSRYIRPGAVFVEIDNANMVAATAADGSALTVVVRNGDKSKAASFTFDLTALAAVGSSVEAYRTSASEDLAHLSPIAVQNWSFTASSPAYSVTTYVIPLAH